MLGRTANGLFWMFRYLERSENTARLIDAALRMALTRDAVAAEEEWRSVIATLGQRVGYEAKNATYSGMQAWNYLLRDRDNLASVRTMLGQVRSNARLSRNAISTELWEAINVSWMEIDELLARPLSQNSVGEAAAMIRRAGTLAHGAMAGTMLRDEGFHFARAGTFVERADNVARILDMKYYLLLPALSYVGSSLDTGQWDNILRSVSGDRAYSYIHAGQIDARGIVEFLVLDPRFPRSLAYSHAALRENLSELARLHGKKGQSNELMLESETSLADLTVERIFETGLHQFLIDFNARNAAIGAAIAQDYRFHA